MTRDGGDVRGTSRLLGVQTGLLVLGVLAVVSAVLVLAYSRSTAADTDALLRRTIANLDKASEAPPGVLVAVVTPSGRSVSAAMPRGLPDEAMIAAVRRDGRTRQDDVRVRGHDFTVRTARVGDRVTQAVVDRQQAEQARDRVLTALLEAGGVGVLLAALVAGWLARRAVRPLAETVALQRRFVADASHELRTPLTLLSTRVQLAVRRARSRGERTAELDGILGDTRVLTELLDDLLVAADTRSAAARSDVELTGLARECLAAARASAHERGVSLDLVADGEVHVAGVPAALRRALTALVDNAVGHATARVEVAVDRQAGVARVRVTDDGPGISADVAPRMFERFTSARAEASPDGRRHYGIGLALVADVAAAHDGRVDADNRDDGSSGAVLTLRLPVSRSGRRPRPAAPPPPR